MYTIIALVAIGCTGGAQVRQAGDSVNAQVVRRSP